MRSHDRQGTAETIEEEVEDERDHRQEGRHLPQKSQDLEGPEAEAGACGGSKADPPEAAEDKEEDQEGQGVNPEEGSVLCDDRQEVEPEERSVIWDSLIQDDGPSDQLREDTISESEDGGGGCQRDSPHAGDLLCTNDTDASKTSDAEVPPSYSKAVSFDRLEMSDDDSDVDRRRRRIFTTSDSRSDSRSDIMLPSMTTELTASELLLNK